MTNDGELARRLELPANGWLRRYKVRVHGVVDPARLATLEKGVTIDGVSYGPIHAEFEGEQRVSNVWLTVSLREGRNREVRKVMAHLGLAVTRLIRLAYGPFQLGNLPRGAHRGSAAARDARAIRRGSQARHGGEEAEAGAPPAVAATAAAAPPRQSDQGQKSPGTRKPGRR